MLDKFDMIYSEHLECFERLHESKEVIMKMGKTIAIAIKNNKRILLCGNGGSAADAQHFAAELVGRFQKERNPWHVVALTTDTSIITAIANDYGFDAIFARQVEAIGARDDFLIGISTSGNSKNIINAIKKAKDLQMNTMTLLGGNGGDLKALADTTIIIPSNITARIQEAHIFILHLWAEIIEIFMTQESNNYE